ncbi:MAG: DHHA1 domain-containing protein [Candidatus Hodarchaeota archaeon]
MLNEASFLEACRKIGKTIVKSDNSHPFYVISHFDADGLAAAAILAKALSREGLNFQLRIFERLESDTINELRQVIPHETNIIFLDIGTGVIDDFLEWPESYKIFILDHHTPFSKVKLPKKIQFLNPHYFSIDGTTHVSGAGVVYLVVKYINPKNRDLAPLAIIGALGDRQDQGNKSSLVGINEIIVKDAKISELISDNVSVWFFDRSRPITSILKRADFIGFENELEIRGFLDKLKIKYRNGEEQRPFYDLSEHECRRLASELIIQRNVDPDEIYKRDYQLIQEEIHVLRDARVFATKLNACGRSQHADVGISLCLGDRQSALRELNLIEKEYSKMIAESMEWVLSNNHIKELTGIYFVDGRKIINERIIGTISSILSSRKETKLKPILGCTQTTTNKIKISMRVSRYQSKKLNLSYLLKQVIKEMDQNFEVGGHAAAAGAIIPEEFLDDFVNRINEFVERMQKV